MKYEYWFPIKGRQKTKCLFCNKPKCNCQDNIGVACHYECAGLSEQPE